MAGRFAGRSRGSIGKSISSKAKRLGLLANSANKIWTIREAGTFGRILEEDLDDDEAWSFLVDYAKKSMSGQVPQSIERLIAITVKSTVRETVAEQFTPIEKVRHAIDAIVELHQLYKRCKSISDRELKTIDHLCNEVMNISQYLERGIEVEEISLIKTYQP